MGNEIINPAASQQDRREGIKRFCVETVQGGNKTDAKYREEIVPLYKTIFRAVYTHLEDLREGQETIKAGLLNPATTLIFLREGASQKLVGFTSASPTDGLGCVHTAETERIMMGLSETAYADMQKETTEVGYTGILQANRRQGGWSLMMDALDEAVRGQKQYTYMLRFVRRAEDYSDKVQKRYKKDIVYKANCEDSDPNDPQDFFRIKLH